MALLREELGRRIAAARTSAGLTQQQLAERIGLKHAQDVSRYERGKTEVPAARIDLIAEATGRPRSYFTRDPGEAEPEPEALDRLQAQVAEMGGQLGRIEQLLRQLVAPRSGSAEA